MTRRLLTALTPLLILGCGPREGDEPGECTDGADNDRDGYFDCNDLDCVMAPDCQDGGDADTDTDSDTDTDTDTDTDSDTDTDTEPSPLLQPLTGVTIDYTLDFAFDIPVLGLEDCDMVFRGEGTEQVEVTGDRVTLSGTWQRTGGSCPEALDDAVWTTNGTAYHSFFFLDSATVVDAWYAHALPAGHTTEARDVWYVTEMGSAIDVTTASPTATWIDSERLPEPPATLSHDVQIVFSKD